LTSIATDRDDTRWINAAVALGTRGQGLTWPNPNVGCIIVASGQVVGRGWTQPGGRPHAEAMALAAAGDAARWGTLYTTLEPCAHISERGPACADLIVAAGVARVVVAVQDPDIRTDGRGLARLTEAGIAVTTGVSSDAAMRSLAGFLIRRRLGRPHVTLKLALSLDGAIARADGSSRWITGEDARAHAHVLRATSDAILVGQGTLAADAPRLDVRLPGLEVRSPRRVLLSTQADPPEGWMVCRRLDDLTKLPADWVLVEGGMRAAAGLLARDLVDRLVVYRAPILIGGGRTLGDIGLADLADAHGRWHDADSRMLGCDRLTVFDRNRT